MKPFYIVGGNTAQTFIIPTHFYDEMARIWKEEWKTYKDVFDQFSERNLYKLILNKTIDGLDSPVSIGKEANIFTAKKGEETLIVKMYRLSTCDFNRMYDNLKTDPRYMSVKPSKRQVIFAWAKREYRNLLLAREAGVSAPTPYTQLYNILIMECITFQDHAAPKLKDQTPKNPTAFYKELVDEVRKITKAKLVHGDLSPYNILNANEHPVIIDWSQAMPQTAPHADEYAKRDTKNLVKYFKKIGVDAKEEDFLTNV